MGTVLSQNMTHSAFLGSSAPSTVSGLTFQDLQTDFDQPLAAVARKLNVCTTFFKKICRHFGIKRWPFRKLKSLEKKITMLEAKATGGKASALLVQYQRQLEQTRAFARADSEIDSESNDVEEDSSLDSAECAVFTPEPKLDQSQQVTDTEQEMFVQLEAEVCLRLSSMFKRNMCSVSSGHRAWGSADLLGRS